MVKLDKSESLLPVAEDVISPIEPEPLNLKALKFVEAWSIVLVESFLICTLV